jgi:molybdate transport system permease protein
MHVTPEEWEVIGLSLKVAALAVVCSLPFGVWIAYGLARRRLPVPFLIENLVQLPLVLPPVVTGLILLVAFGPGSVVGGWLEQVLGIRIAFTWVGAALAAAIVSFPLLVQSIRIAFAQVDPEWEEAGYVYGGSRWAVFRLITLPLAARGIAGGVVLAFARALGEFGATIVVAGNIPGQTRTLPLAVFTYFSRIGGEAAVMRLVTVSIVLSVLSLLLHALLTRRLHNLNT